MSEWARFIHIINFTRLVVIVVRAEYARAHLRIKTKIWRTRNSENDANSYFLENYWYLRFSENIWISEWHYSISRFAGKFGTSDFLIIVQTVWKYWNLGVSENIQFENAHILELATISRSTRNFGISDFIKKYWTSENIGISDSLKMFEFEKIHIFENIQNLELTKLIVF